MLRYGDISEDKYSMRRYLMTKEMLKDVVFPKAKVLDIGCYDGFFLSLLPDINGYGVDSDGEALKIAQERGIKTLPSLDTPFRFDIVLCMEVLEHLQDPTALLLKIKNILTPNGKVIISIPNECTLWHRFKVLMGWGISASCFSPWYHLHFPSLKQNDKFVSKHFKIIKKRYWVYGLPQWFAFWPGLFARGVIYVCECSNSNL